MSSVPVLGGSETGKLMQAIITAWVLRESLWLGKLGTDLNCLCKAPFKGGRKEYLRPLC